jgi:hypothetical protein
MRRRLKTTLPPQVYRYVRAERAMTQLAKIAMQIDAKEFAQFLIERNPDGRRLGDPGFVGQWLDDVWSYTSHIEDAKRPKCIVCGADHSDRLDRPNARYCSDRCRQKAYRARNRLDVSEPVKA